MLERLGSKRLSEDDIMDHLQETHGQIWRGLNAPPAWVDCLQKATMGGKGWAIVGKRGASSKSSTWAFWTSGRDLDHLAHLDYLLRNPEPDVAAVENMFAALDDSDTASSGNGSTGQEDSDADGDDLGTPADEEEGQVENAADAWAFLLGNQDRHVAWEDDWEDDSSSGGEELQPKVQSRLASRVATPIITIEEALQDPNHFLDFFGLTELPLVPSTDRERDVLLLSSTCRNIWGWSKYERGKVARFIEARLKEEIDRQDVDQFETLTRRHAILRADFEEARGAVCLSIVTRRTYADHQKRAHIMRSCQLLASTTTGEAMDSDRS